MAIKLPIGKIRLIFDHHATTQNWKTIPHFSHQRRFEVSAKLEGRKLPLLLFLGEQGSHNPASIKKMREDYSQTLVAILTDCGHYATIENPHDFNHALLNFYAGLERDLIDWYVLYDD